MIDEIKKKIAQGNFAQAIQDLIQGTELENRTNQLLNFDACIKTIPVVELEKQEFTFKKIAILGGYNTQFFAPLVRAQLFKAKISVEIFESEYGLLEQLIHSNDASLQSFAPDICYFCVGFDHLNAEQMESETDRWRGLWAKCFSQLKCEIIQNTFEEPIYRAFGNLEFSSPQSIGYKVRKLNQALLQNAPPYVHFSDIDNLASQIGRRQWRDEKLYDMAKLPVAFSLLPTYAENVSAVCAAIFGKTKKCLVLDLDNTLWGGVIGDDGVANIKIGQDSGVGEAFCRFQKYILQLKARGIILAVCSKNEEGIAKEAFTSREDMLLSLSDFSCFVANWDPKPDNLRKIARTLNIGLDAIVFADDNPAECEIVKQFLPQVAVLLLSGDPSTFTAKLASRYYFETITITTEDLSRTIQYQANQAREGLEQSIGNYDEFLKQLQMQANIAAFNTANNPRITQLINKTNQFNLTGKRYTEAEIADFSGSAAFLTRYVKLQDKFGDNGLISVLIGRVIDETLEIDTWLMSCRVLKRRVEDLLFQSILEESLGRGLKKITAVFNPTTKNAMVKNLLGQIGFHQDSILPNGSTFWSFDLTDQDQVSFWMKKEVPINVNHSD